MGKKRTKKTKKAVVPVTEVKKKNSQILPNREALLFKQMKRYYDKKQYAKGVKTADQILKRFPLHGETLALKGLTFNSMDKKEEAMVLVKKGLAMNIKSHVCWHVYGLIYRADHMYNDAIKCYQNALRIDEGNLDILSDLSNLQIQRRLMAGFAETGQKMLALQSTKRNNWLAYSIGNHLDGKHSRSIQILDSYMDTMDKDITHTSSGRYEYSELLMYRNMILRESGDTVQALEHLNEIDDEVCDRLAYNQLKAELMMETGDLTGAEKEWRGLLKKNPEHHGYHKGLRKTLNLLPEGDAELTEAQAEKLLALYKEFAVEYPKCQAVKWFPLNFLPGSSAEFEIRVREQLLNGITRGIPSLFRQLKPLYSDAIKVEVITNVFTGYVENLRKNNRFHAEDEEGSASPVALVWSLYFAAHHYDHLSVPDKALAAVNEAIEHTPTNIDLYVLKARIYKHAGDPTTAFALMDRARALDTADRYLNTKCVRYAFRAGEIKRAQTIVGMFLRDGDTLVNMFDMQCMWYELSFGDCYRDAGDWGKALKMYSWIETHLETITEDQFDFHNYCLRKTTLRAYISMLRFEDTLRSHRFFFRAAQEIIDLYVKIHDKRTRPKEEKKAAVFVAPEGSTPEEQARLEKKNKRQAAKARKAALEAEKLKEAQEAVEKAKAAKEKKAETRRGGGGGKEEKKDDDPDGKKLVEVEDPLAAATEYVNKLLFYSSERVEPHLCAASVYLRKAKFVLVLKSLLKAHAIDPTHPLLHQHLCFFLHRFAEAKNLHKVTTTIIEDAKNKHTSALGNGKSALELNQAFIAEHAPTSLKHALAAAKVAIELSGEAGQAEAVNIIASVPADNLELKHAISVLAFLTEKVMDEKVTVSFSSKCAQRFPFCVSFMSADKLEVVKKNAEIEGREDKDKDLSTPSPTNT